jgi:hypothetical protein
MVAAALVAALATACQAGPTSLPVSSPAATGPTSTASASPAAPSERPSEPPTTPTPTVPRSAALTAAVVFRLPAAISRAVAFPDGTSILLAGGLTPGGTTAAIVDITIDTGAVTELGTLVAPVHDAGGALVAGTPAIFGGGDLVAGSTVQRIGAGAASLLGNLPKARADLSVVNLAEVTYVVGGGTPTRPDPTVLATGDGATFSVITRLPVPVRYAAVAAVDGWIVVVGGSDGTRDRTEIQAIDPASGTATIIGHMPDAISHAAAVVVDGRLIVAGGRIRGRATDRIWEIDPKSGVAVEIGRLPRSVSDAAAVVVDGVGYLVGGEDTGLLRSVISIAFTGGS